MVTTISQLLGEQFTRENELNEKTIALYFSYVLTSEFDHMYVIYIF